MIRNIYTLTSRFAASVAERSRPLPLELASRLRSQLARCRWPISCPALSRSLYPVLLRLYFFSSRSHCSFLAIRWAGGQALSGDPVRGSLDRALDRGACRRSTNGAPSRKVLHGDDQSQPFLQHPLPQCLYATRINGAPPMKKRPRIAHRGYPTAYQIAIHSTAAPDQSQFLELAPKTAPTKRRTAHEKTAHRPGKQAPRVMVVRRTFREKTAHHPGGYGAPPGKAGAPPGKERRTPRERTAHRRGKNGAPPMKYSCFFPAKPVKSFNRESSGPVCFSV